jgi:putative DNA primase/helicase
MRNIDNIRGVVEAASGHWPFVLQRLGIKVPGSSSKHSACPACGGKDRFRFDDKGRGDHICNRCGAGDGLDLVQKVRHVSATEAANQVAAVLNHVTSSCTVGTEYSQQNGHQETNSRRLRFMSKYQALVAKAVSGQSQYLAAKGLNDERFLLLPDGSLLLPLVDESESVVAAQTITVSGEKKLLSGSAKRGAWHSLSEAGSARGIIVCEGLATGLSVQCMQPDAMVVVGLDAGNLTPVAQAMRRKYPDSRIIIAADNDWQGEQQPNVGLAAAEKAATVVNGWIALPPVDSKADWNDYHQRFGLNKASDDFSASVVQYQSKASLTAPAISAEAEVYTFENDPLKARVEARRDGLFWVVPKVDKESGEIIHQENWLSTPMEVVGRGRDDKDQYLVISWSAFGSDSPTTRAIPLADIGEKEGWRMLKAGGVNITAKSSLRATLADWLQRSSPNKLWLISHSTGWHHGAYVMPDGDIIGSPEQPVLFSGRTSATSGYIRKGTSESWREHVARLANGNYCMMIAIGAAFAAPLLGICGADGFGLHFYAQSSAGKTTTANVASSLYGCPDLLRLTWYGTSLGLANEASAHNDGLMPLDEVGQGSDPISVSQSAYALFNGVGKLQGAKEGGNRDLKRWRTLAISTGEMDLETFISTAGHKTKAGQLVRLLNIPLSKAGCFHEYENGKQHADALKNGYQNHFGNVGREWIKWLADHQQEALDAVHKCEMHWRNQIPTEHGEQVHRVGSRFAVIEAALLLSRTFTGWDEKTCVDAVQHCYRAWLDGFGSGNKEREQIIEQAEAFLNAHGLSRFAPIPYDPAALPIRDLAGYRQRGKQADESITFYVFPDAFKNEMAKGFNIKQFCEVLIEAGMLIPPTSDRGYMKKSPRVNGRQARIYELRFRPED